ncbi:hypothetical protein C900_04033 [Fulvivirga imtechensis AK7]|uniref:DinB-like domain-containing protein n=1 Tax=Fulvivirga imtechensis AK7 TaxID=1237149 RepID=L8JQ77_9BACT|nr:DinB family protein [Fulvivirga imtechensis]ELR70348.1 hypothetical protein C900_04033 [Fulvivirga imtechensis AK7]
MGVISNSLIHALDGRNSHLPASVVLEGLKPEIAGKYIEGSPYTIWQQIEHINFWQERYIGHIKGQTLPKISDLEEGWPGEDAPSGKAELDAAISSLAAGIAEVRTMLSRGAEIKYPSNYNSGYDVITSMAMHLSYHLGQIMIMRRILGDYPPPSGGYTW